MNVVENQRKIDNCIDRVRAARNSGVTFGEVFNHFSKEFSPDIIFYSWHAAKILDDSLSRIK